MNRLTSEEAMNRLNKRDQLTNDKAIAILDRERDNAMEYYRTCMDGESSEAWYGNTIIAIDMAIKAIRAIETEIK